MKTLSRQIAPGLNGAVHSAPTAAVFALPEKVLQFGAGVLLRGLPDYYIDIANKLGIFNGRVVVVKSTDSGPGGFEEQHCLYTHCIRGVQNQQQVEENIINASISRVLTARTQWQAVLDCAAGENMQVVISNTTDAGLSLHPDDNIHDAPPRSFPAKLLAFLKKRYDCFHGDEKKGMVILPTELVPDNGRVLQQLVMQLAEKQCGDPAFLHWLLQANQFCNTLVDRIVPGAMSRPEHEAQEQRLGYRDGLMIMSEAYHLWAIETDSPAVKDILSFAQASPQVIITNDIQKHRELKLRLLNATHTFSCALAMLAGIETVSGAMQDSQMGLYIHDLMVHEIIPCIAGPGLTVIEAHEFAAQVLDRFRNPYIQHQWQSVALQYSAKIKGRCVPLLAEYVRRRHEVPPGMALGLAAWLLLMRCTAENGVFTTTINGTGRVVNDDNAAYFEDIWRGNSPEAVVTAVLANTALWGQDLLQVNGLAEAVTGQLQMLLQHGAMHTIMDMQRAAGYADSVEA